MNDEQVLQEKDFRNLLAQITNHSETRDKMISEIDEIIDRIKLNRRPIVQEKGSEPSKESTDVISQIRALIHKMDSANERTRMIINRLDELV